MANNIKSLFEFINKMSSLYVAPYHRGYHWDEVTCEKFLSSALDSEEKTLDFGVITYQKCDDQGNYILVDGYQRLMTILLFVQALIKTAKIKLAEKNQPSNFLVKKNDDGDDIFKLKINNNDKNDIENIIKNNFDEVVYRNCNFVVNYQFFEKQLASKKLPVLDLLCNIAKIRIVNVTIDGEDVEAEEVYFDMNQHFTQFDLISNYVYRKLKEEKQIHIYNTYWLGLSKTLGYSCEKFFADYLTIQNNGLIPETDEIYDYFVKFFEYVSKLKQKDDMIKHIYRYATYYEKILKSDVKDNALNDRLAIINTYEAKDTYAYLMEVFEDYDFAHINKHMLLDILDTIISFVEQRANSEAGALAVNFASLSKDINKMLLFKNFTPKIVTTKVRVEEIEDAEYELYDEQPLTINDILKRKSTV